MQKTLYTQQYRALLALLRQTRLQAGLNQQELAERLQWSQVNVSKCETGVRRLDVIELKLWVQALGGSLPSFLTDLQSRTDLADLPERGAPLSTPL